MIINTLKTGFRRMSRERSFIILNISGLSIGVAAVLLIFLTINYELSFNQNFKNYDRIVRLVAERNNSQSGQSFLSGMPTSAMIKAQNSIPQFKASSRIRFHRPTIIVPGEETAQPENKMILGNTGIAGFVEPAFFEVFDFRWTEGEPAFALEEPNSVALSRSLANLLFPDKGSVLGHSLLIDNIPMVIRGIYEDAPENCDLPVKLVISYATILADRQRYDYVENWMRYRGNDQFYALLQDASLFDEANEAVSGIGIHEYAAAANRQQIGENRHFLQPLSQLHYDARFYVPGGRVIEKGRLWILGSVGFLILLMACFNFINLSTSQALKRSKEVGVRKTLGGSRGALFFQFIGETALLVFFSGITGVVIANGLFPYFSEMTGLPVHPTVNGYLVPAIFIILLMVLVTSLAGTYPALVMSGFSPVKAMKGEKISGQIKGVSVRKTLVALQFAIAQALIVGAVISTQQMNFIRHADLGFNQDLIYLFSFENTGETRNKLNRLKEQVVSIPQVQSLTFTNLPPASGGSWQTNFSIGRGSGDQPFNTSYLLCDADFQQTFGIHLIAGKWFKASDTITGYVINETLMRQSGITDPLEAITKELRLENDPYLPVVGVVKDFHSKPLQEGFEPIVLASYQPLYVAAGVKIRPENINTTIALVKSVFDATFPDQVFRGQFFDQTIADFYLAEERFSKTSKAFSLVAILISCLGLFGISAYAAESRKKEVVIRKILGASVGSIVAMLTREFLLMVLIASIIALPIAYFLMSKWLNDFVYRISIQAWVFVLAGGIVAIIAISTVGFHSLKVSLANPNDALRDE